MNEYRFVMLHNYSKINNLSLILTIQGRGLTIAMWGGSGFCFQKGVRSCAYRMAGGGGYRGVRVGIGEIEACGEPGNNCKAQHSNALIWPDSV